MPEGPSIEIADTGFAGHLLTLSKYRRTGVLEVRAEPVTTFVYLLSGVPVFAEEGTLGEALGRVLLQQKLLSQEQYAAVIQRMTDTPIGSEQMRFGEVAVLLGYLTHEQVNDALAEQVRQRVLRCFQWPSPKFRFQNVPEALDEVAHYPIAVEPLVLEGIRRFYDFGRTQKILGPVEHCYPTLDGTSEEVGRRFEMKANEAQFLGDINGRRTVAQLLASCALDPLHGAQVLAAVVTADGVIFDEERQVNSVQMRALNVSSVTVKRTGETPKTPAAEAPSPPVVRGPPRIPRRDRPRVTRPAAESARPSAPPPANVKKQRLLAEAAFQRGKSALADGALGKALKELKRAHSLHAEAVEYELYATWVEFLTSKDSDWQGALRQSLEGLVMRAVRENSQMAFAHYVKAHLSLRDGNEEAALKGFRVVLRLDPDHRDAERHYRVLAQRKR